MTRTLVLGFDKGLVMPSIGGIQLMGLVFDIYKDIKRTFLMSDVSKNITCCLTGRKRRKHQS